MSLKLKAMSLGILATMAMGAFAVMNATAETGGHFTAEQANTTVTAQENTAHHITLAIDGLNGIECTTASYDGILATTTETQLKISPTFTGCHTTGGPVAITVDRNECNYIFTIGKKSTAENTVDLQCLGAKKFIGVTHEGCEIKFPEQAGLKGVTYNTDTNEVKHSITLGVNVTGVTAHFEAGFCVLLGTKQVASLTGSLTVKGSVAGNPVGITATGSEG